MQDAVELVTPLRWKSVVAYFAVNWTGLSGRGRHHVNARKSCVREPIARFRSLAQPVSVDKRMFLLASRAALLPKESGLQRHFNPSGDCEG